MKENKTNRARLIKKEDAEKQVVSVLEKKKVTGSLRNSVEVVRDWIKTHQATSETQSRQMFAALFQQPQTE
jgi:hypothetical protein